MKTVDFPQFDALHVEAWFEDGYKVLKLRSKAYGIPNVTLGLLKDLKQFALWVNALDPAISEQVRYIVSTSAHENAYNLGGDLKFFAACIHEKRFGDLTEYARMAVEVIFDIRNAFGLQAITIAQCNGKALGGGFECSLAHDYILASETAGFSFPEKKFNLFPGMGAYSLLNRKLSREKTEIVLRSDRIFSPEEMKEIGIVAEVYGEHEAESSLKAFIRKLDKSFNFEYFHLHCNKHVHAVTLEELYAITGYWVEACMGLNKRDIEVIEVLVAAQNRRMQPKAHCEMI